jgi:DNA replication protein DnaC
MMRELTLDGLDQLYLRGMKEALTRQLEDPAWNKASFEERLTDLIAAENLFRENRLLEGRLKRARVSTNARIEELEHRAERKFDKALVQSLSTCRWLKDKRNAILTGPTGVGKTFLASVLTHKACQEGYSARYLRLPRLLADLEIAKAEGGYRSRLASLARIDLIVLDDWLVTPLSEAGRRDLLEILDDRYDRRSTMVAAQLPPEHWHEAIGEPTLADAILDRLVHNAYRLNIEGESMRKAKGLGPRGGFRDALRNEEGSHAAPS